MLTSCNWGNHYLDPFFILQPLTQRGGMGGSLSNVHTHIHTVPSLGPNRLIIHTIPSKVKLSKLLHTNKCAEKVLHFLTS